MNNYSMKYNSTKSNRRTKMETRKEQKERRRQAIIYAGLELFVNKGYASTKITDIAERVNMSTGLLFHYFDSKEKLYEELVRIGLEGTNYPQEQNYEHAIEFFSHFVEQLFGYMRQQPVVAKFFVLMAEAQRSEGTPKHIRKIAMQVETIEQFVPIIEWGQKEGTIRAGDPRVISNAFWSCIQGISERYAVNQEIDLPDADWIVDIVRSR
jgi:AcrR family transcriptional regulator